MLIVQQYPQPYNYQDLVTKTEALLKENYNLRTKLNLLLKKEGELPPVGEMLNGTQNFQRVKNMPITSCLSTLYQPSRDNNVGKFNQASTTFQELVKKRNRKFKFSGF